LLAREIEIKTPITEDAARNVNAGDMVYLTGSIFVFVSPKACMRTLDEFHKTRKLPMNLEGGVMGHCGVVLKKKEKGYDLVFFGPTTSARMDGQNPDMIETFKMRAVIGKGGMSRETLESMKKVGCFYMLLPGGCTPIFTAHTRGVLNTYFPELEWYDAVHEIAVERLGPLVVTMDAKGHDLHGETEKEANDHLGELYKQLQI